MISIRQILKTKGRDFFSITSNTKVIDALRLMAEKNVGALLVIDADTLSGIFSERDYARRSIIQEQLIHNQLVDALMTKNVISIAPDKTIYDCMTMMTEKHIRHLPVIENEKIIGIVSIGDIVNAVILEQKSTIKNLESYISGSAYSEE